MRAILLGLTLLSACSGGSDLLAPSEPSGPPSVFPHGIRSDGPVVTRLAPSLTPRSATSEHGERYPARDVQSHGT
jgi:hypothetical protein